MQELRFRRWIPHCPGNSLPQWYIVLLLSFSCLTKGCFLIETAPCLWRLKTKARKSFYIVCCGQSRSARFVFEEQFELLCHINPLFLVFCLFLCLFVFWEKYGRRNPQAEIKPNDSEESFVQDKKWSEMKEKMLIGRLLFLHLSIQKLYQILPKC